MIEVNFVSLNKYFWPKYKFDLLRDKLQSSSLLFFFSYDFGFISFKKVLLISLNELMWSYFSRFKYHCDEFFHYSVKDRSK